MNEDGFLMLSEDKAVGHHFFIDNFKLYKWLIRIALFSSVFSLSTDGSDIFANGLIGLLIGVPLFGILWLLSDKDITKNNFYLLFRILLILIYIVFMGGNFMIWKSPAPIRIVIAFLYPFSLIFFRLRSSDLINTFLILFMINLFDFLVPYNNSKSFILVTILFISYCGFLGSGLFLSSRKKKIFLKGWHKEVEKNKDRLRMKLELERAKEIQLDMLPKSIPVSEKLDIAWQSLPATEVGGDYYDSFVLNEHEIALIIGDVSGHGLGSGLVLSGARAGLHLLHDNASSPQEILLRLNKMMKRTTDKKTFMTMLYSSFNLKNNIVTLSNAGHTSVFHYSAEQDKILEIRQPSFPLGMRLDVSYKEVKVPFYTGDVFLFYSDGLSEAMNPDNQQYEEVRLLEFFKDQITTNNNVSEVMKKVLKDVDAFCEGLEQKDDITIVLVKIK